MSVVTLSHCGRAPWPTKLKVVQPMAAMSITHQMARRRL